MGQLQDLFEEVISNRALEIVVEHVVKRCVEIGMRPTRRHRQLLMDALRKGETVTLRQWRWSWPPWGSDNRELVITDEDVAAIQAEHDQLLGRLDTAVRLFIDQSEDRIKGLILDSYPDQLREEERDLRGFRRRLSKRWERPDSLLRIIIALSERIAVDSAPNGIATLSDSNGAEAVLRRLHGRGVRIAKEALVLIEAGFADGAMARWRTLHEVTVVALFIQEHGDACARLYLAHNAVENYRAAKSYRQYHEALGYEPLEEQSWLSLEAAYVAALRTHGEAFATEYGWARTFLGGRAANFAEIEASIALQHLRPFYKLASQQVHAGPLGISSGLSHDPERLVLLGPSNVGLSEPGENVGLTLAVLTTVLLRFAPELDVLVAVKVLSALAEDAAKAWVEIQDELDQEAQTQWQ